MKKLLMCLVVSSLSLSAFAIEGDGFQFEEGSRVFEQSHVSESADGDVVVSTGSLIVDKKNGNSLSLRCTEADTVTRGCSKAAVYLEDSEGVRPITKDLDKEDLALISQKIRETVITHVKLPKAMWNVPFFSANNWMCKKMDILGDDYSETGITNMRKCRLVSGLATAWVASAVVGLWIAPAGSALSLSTAAGEMSGLGAVHAIVGMATIVAGVPLAASMVTDIIKAPIYPVIGIRNLIVKIKNNKRKKELAQAQDAIQSLARGGTLKIKHNAFEALTDSIRAF